MANKLTKDGSFGWLVHNPEGKYVGRIEKDQHGCWYVINSKGSRASVWSYKEARIEARDFLKVAPTT